GFAAIPWTGFSFFGRTLGRLVTGAEAHEAVKSFAGFAGPHSGSQGVDGKACLRLRCNHFPLFFPAGSQIPVTSEHPVPESQQVQASGGGQAWAAQGDRGGKASFHQPGFRTLAGAGAPGGGLGRAGPGVVMLTGGRGGGTRPGSYPYSG